MLVGISVSLLSSCVLGDATERPPALLPSMPPGTDLAPACAIVSELPSGDPLSDVATGSRRLEAAVAAIDEDPVDLVGLRAALADQTQRIEYFASTLRAASDALALDVANPLDLAAAEWSALLPSMGEQHRLTLLALNALGAAQTGRGTGLSADQWREYQEVAREWQNAQRVVLITVAQLEWTHDRAMEALTECGELPVFDVAARDG